MSIRKHSLVDSTADDLQALVGKTVATVYRERMTETRGRTCDGRVVIGFTDRSAVELCAAPQGSQDLADIDVCVTAPPPPAPPPAPRPRTLVVCRSGEYVHFCCINPEHDIVSAEGLANSVPPELDEYDLIVLKRGAIRSTVSVAARRLAAYLKSHPKCVLVSEDPSFRFPPNEPARGCHNCSGQLCPLSYPDTGEDGRHCGQWSPRNA